MIFLSVARRCLEGYGGHYLDSRCSTILLGWICGFLGSTLLCTFAVFSPDLRKEVFCNRRKQRTFRERFWICGSIILVFPVLFSLILGVSSSTMADRYGIEFKRVTSGALWSKGGVERLHTKLRTLIEVLLQVYPSMTLSLCVNLAHKGKNYFPIGKLGY